MEGRQGTRWPDSGWWRWVQLGIVALCVVGSISLVAAVLLGVRWWPFAIAVIGAVGLAIYARGGRRAAMLDAVGELGERILGGTLSRSRGMRDREALFLLNEVRVLRKSGTMGLAKLRRIRIALLRVERAKSELAETAAETKAGMLELDPDSPGIASEIVRAAAWWDAGPNGVAARLDAMSAKLERLGRLVVDGVVHDSRLREIRDGDGRLREWLLIAYERPDRHAGKRPLMVSVEGSRILLAQPGGPRSGADGCELIARLDLRVYHQIGDLVITPESGDWNALSLVGGFRAHAPNSELEALARVGREMLSLQR